MEEPNNLLTLTTQLHDLRTLHKEISDNIQEISDLIVREVGSSARYEVGTWTITTSDKPRRVIDADALAERLPVHLFDEITTRSVSAAAFDRAFSRGDITDDDIVAAVSYIPRRSATVYIRNREDANHGE